MQSDIMRARFATAFSNKKAESYYCTLCRIGLSYKEGREASVGRKKVVENRQTESLRETKNHLR